MSKDRDEARARPEASFQKQQRADPEAAEATAEREAQARVVAVNTSPCAQAPFLRLYGGWTVYEPEVSRCRTSSFASGTSWWPQRSSCSGAPTRKPFGTARKLSSRSRPTASWSDSLRPK